MRSPSSPGRGWTLFSAIGIPLWIGATVLAAVLNDDPADPAPVLATFAAGGTLFFAAMFGAALWGQLRRPAGDERARFWKRAAIGYSLTGIVVTGLGLGLIWQQALGGGDVRLLLYPLLAIVVVWAAVALGLLRRLRSGGADESSVDTLPKSK